MINSKERKLGLSGLMRVLVWPSGSDSDVLALCVSEQNYYGGLGILVWLNSLLAGSGMALMLSQTGGSRAQALAGGVFWFLCVLNLDRFLLMARYETSGWKKLMPVARILLSLCLAIIIGEHVVQFLFRSEINTQLSQEALAAQQSNYHKALAGFPEIPALNEEKKAKQNEIERKEAEVGKLRDDYIHEAEGTAGSRIRGKGMLYEQKQRDYETALASQRQLEAELQAINVRLEDKNKQLRSVVEAANEVKANERGFLAYHRALFEIIKKDFTLLFLYLVISMAMILFEITPLISKLGGKRRFYDYVADKEMEFKKSAEDERQALELQDLKNETKRRSNLASKILQLQVDIVDEVSGSVHAQTHSNLTGDKAALADLIKSQVYDTLIKQITPPSPVVARENVEEKFDRPFDSSNPATVTIFFKEEDEDPFTIIFRQPQDAIKGHDLIYALAGLEQQRFDNTATRLPLHEYQVTNEQGHIIDLNKYLFPQIQVNHVVYLSTVETTVSHAEN